MIDNFKTVLGTACSELLRRCSVDLPGDVESALKQACAREEQGSPAAECLQTICNNVVMAREQGSPLCQDTGVPVFFVECPDKKSEEAVKQAVVAAVEQAVVKGLLRPNCVKSITGRNTGTGTGVDFPLVKMVPGDHGRIRITLLLKGGGSENVSGQMSLPCIELQAQRDMEGIKRVVLGMVHQAQGKGCSPGILGIGIGGDRELSYSIAKKQLLRKLSDTNLDIDMAALELELLQEINSLGIGPMGLGGKTTVLGVKVGVAERHPACFFVSMAYMCWACRRHSLVIHGDGAVIFDGESDGGDTDYA